MSFLKTLDGDFQVFSNPSATVIAGDFPVNSAAIVTGDFPVDESHIQHILNGDFPVWGVPFPVGQDGDFDTVPFRGAAPLRLRRPR